MKLALQLVTLNGAQYLPYLLRSLAAQTFRDWRLFVLDNGSSGPEWAATEEAVRESGLPATFIRSTANIGFASGHNRLYSEHQAEYVQLLNQDAFLEPDYLERLLKHLEVDPHCGAAAGVIYRWDFTRRQEAGGGRTATVDSLGIRRSWFGQVADIGAGAPLPDNFGIAPRRVLGVSGCLPMYRRTALWEAHGPRRIFDPAYFSYKEDVDLALRFESSGWTAATVPAAVAYHCRSLGAGARQPISSPARYLSLRNHGWLTRTHWRWSDLWRRPGIIPYELAKLGYWALQRPEGLKRFWQDTAAYRGHLARARAFVRELRSTKKPQQRPTAVPEADVVIITVSWNGLTDAGLKSWAEAIAATRRAVRLVVVDNASPDYRAEELVWRHVPDAAIVLRNRNSGFGRSNNRGAAEVRGRHYLFLNPDTKLSDPTVIDRLCDHLDAHPECGLAAPQLVGDDGAAKETCRRFPAWYMPIVQRTDWGRTAWGRRYADRFLMVDYDRRAEQEVDWVQGSVMCLPAAVWDRLGGFDDRFWMYYEDIDLCRRVRQLGYRLTFLPQLSVVHTHRRESADIRNHLLNILKSRATRGHIASWLKYHLKWGRTPAPSAELELN